VQLFGTFWVATCLSFDFSSESPIFMTDPEMPLLLYVEDEFLIRATVIDGLEEAGFNVIVAKSGAEALVLLTKQGSELRGVLTDIDLGQGIDGWEVARIARETVSGLPIVYVSAASQQDWTSRGVPGSIMIAKPFATAQVVVAISSLMTESGTPT
jgi:CheY-like chemotaxis protein